MMSIQPEIDDPPEAFWWPPELPVWCAPECNENVRPYQFQTIWRLEWIPSITMADPVTYLPVKRAKVIGSEFWFFLTQTGCLSYTPGDFPINPYRHLQFVHVLLQQQADSRRKAWDYTKSVLLGMGARSPGTIELMKDAREAIMSLTYK